MLNDRIEAKWIDAFVRVFELCKVQRGELCAILSETQSRDDQCAFCASWRWRASARARSMSGLPTQRQDVRLPVRSTGASDGVRRPARGHRGAEAGGLVVGSARSRA